MDIVENSRFCYLSWKGIDVFSYYTVQLLANSIKLM